MANLIDQMNILKGLDDQTLGAELNRPSGAVPPYLVMSEISRRKDMRQRYEGQLAQQQPATTVLQDQLSGLAPPPGVAAGQGAPQAMPGGFGSSPAGQGAPMPAPSMGIAAAAPAGPPTGYRHGGIVHYAKGGYVDDSSYWLDPDQSVDDSVNLPDSVGVPTLSDSMTAVIPGNPSASGINVPSQGADPMLMAQLPVDSATPVYAGTSAAAAPSGQTIPAAPDMPPAQGYGDIVAAYQKQIAQAEHDREQAKWLGLMQAGLAIAGGQSPSALTNIGQGGQVGLAAYQDSLKAANAETGTALAGLSSVQRDKLDQQNTRFNQNISSQDLALKQQAAAAAADPNSPQNLPTAIREANYVNAMPENTPEQIAAKQAAMQIITPYAAQAAASKNDQAAQIGDAIIAGDQPPTTTGLGIGMSGPVKAYLASKGYNLTDAYLKFQADLKNVAALNSTAQTRLRQSIDQLEPTLSSAQDLADKWNGSGFPPLNKAALMAAKNDPTNPEKQALATNLLAQVDHVTAELGQVYMGGNSPTDAAFKLSGSQLSGEWSKSTFDAAIKQIQENIAYRKASLNQTAVYPQSSSIAAPPAAAPVAVAGAPVKIIGDADYEALPSGTSFVGPDGVPRRKP